MTNQGRISARLLRRAAAARRPDRITGPKGAAGKPLGSEHLESLEAQMDTLRAAIELETRTDFGDPPAGDRHNRADFLAHFPGLQTALAEWDTLVERVRVAPGAVWEWFAQATTEREFDEPRFAVGPLIDRLATLTVERARDGRLSTSQQLHFEDFKAGSTSRERVSLYVDGQNVAQFPIKAAATHEEQLMAAAERIQALFDDAQSCKQAREIASARNALLAIKHELLDRLARHASVEAVAFAADCPSCQRDSRLETSACTIIARDSAVSLVPSSGAALEAWEMPRPTTRSHLLRHA